MSEYQNYQDKKKQDEDTIKEFSQKEAEKNKQAERQELNDSNTSEERKNQINKWGSINNESIAQEKAYKKLKKNVAESLAKRERRETTEMIAKAFQSLHKTYSIRDDNKSEIYVYQDGIYRPNGKTFIKEFCRDIAGFEFTTQLINEIILKIEVDTYIEPDKFFDSEPKKEICVENGVLDVETKELKEYSSEKIFFNKLPLYYEPSKKIDRALEFFKDIFENQEDIDMLQEFFGYLLYKDYQIEKAFMFLGKGRNGKGQLLELMKSFVGNENVSAVSLQRLCDEDSFNICELHKKLINVGGDISDSYIETTGMFKQLTGNDTVSAQRKFMNDLKFKNYSKLVFSCNQLPKPKDNSRGFWDRWILLKFPYRFEYPELIENLSDEEKAITKPRKNNIIQGMMSQEEMSGLLNWALNGLERLLKQEHFTFTPATQNVRDRWIKEADSFAAFCDEWLEEDYDSMITKEELRSAYHQFCKTQRIKSVGDKAMKNYLVQEMGAYDSRYQEEGQQIPIWKNIKFSKGSKDSKGFSTHIRIGNFAMGVKKHTKSTNYTSDDEKTTPVEELRNYIFENSDKNGLVHIYNIYARFGKDLITKAKKEGVIYQPKNGYLKNV